MDYERKLKGKYALVAGATRGAGRGIAISLAEAGAFVFVTGRSSRNSTGNRLRPETIEETVEKIEERGGVGMAIRTDHNNEDELSKLVEIISEETGGTLDVLINDIWGGESVVDWTKPFWEQDFSTQMAMYSNAVFTHIRTTIKSIPLLMKSKGAVIAEITDGIGYHYRGNLFYSLVKIATNHLALAYASDLQERGLNHITSVGLTPGFLRSEEMLTMFGVTESTWRNAINSHPDFAGSETPFYIGRALVSLISDQDIRRFNGQTLSTWNLSKIYDFVDVDGTRPDWEYFHRLYREGKIDPHTWKYE